MLWVVIPHHSRREELNEAVKASRPWPTIVVDDSHLGGLRLEQENVSVVRSDGEQGFARAANRGISEAESRGASFILLLNDDAVPRPGMIESLLRAMEEHAEGDSVVGPVLEDEDGVQSAGFSIGWWGRIRERRKVPQMPGAFGVEVDGLSGACLLISQGMRFDPAYRHGMEDLDLCLRLRAQGKSVRLIPQARCFHEGGATVPRRSRAAQRHAVSGHLRLVNGGWRTGIVLGLAIGQVLRERGGLDRWIGVAEGWRDWNRARSQSSYCGEPG